MSSVTTERRLKSRVRIDGKMMYHLVNSDEVYLGELEDLSDEGARIWIQQDLPAGSQLFCRIESDEQEQADIEFKATLLRGQPDQRDSMYGYGCIIGEE